jgi:diguanylate cyclase (GGDEF)-like protein
MERAIHEHLRATPATALAAPLPRLPRPVAVGLGLAVVAGIAVLDYATGPRVLLSIFYLLPVMAVTWSTSSTACGAVVMLGSCVVGPVEFFIAGSRYDSLPVAVWNALVRLAVFSIVLYLLERQRQLVGSLQELAQHDELTGLANLRSFRETAAREVERSRRFGHALSLAYLDIDDFKDTNDRQGHEAGDRALISLASVALATVRSVDTVARLGGDEFVVLMPETGMADALPVARRLREGFSRATGGSETRLTCSVGLASFESAPDSVEEIVAAADTLLYEAKQAGKDTVRHALLRAGSRGGAAAGRLLPFSAPPA